MQVTPHHLDMRGRPPEDFLHRTLAGHSGIQMDPVQTSWSRISLEPQESKVKRKSRVGDQLEEKVTEAAEKNDVLVVCIYV